ncbi:MAG: hypothetical protein DRR08_25380 [Candidatus Parabeggiatoa sp. nov. 2]|nr:MAG: hypothetical protein B6247_12480 [Beggiatoa sp. 4572_84]RKZ55037.1 MAG: hypothetical protein DRR08_25380 [Gammaproteobacteria bacterium]
MGNLKSIAAKLKFGLLSPNSSWPTRGAKLNAIGVSTRIFFSPCQTKAFHEKLFCRKTQFEGHVVI